MIEIELESGHPMRQKYHYQTRIPEAENLSHSLLVQLQRNPHCIRLDLQCQEPRIKPRVGDPTTSVPDTRIYNTRY
jgi:hypothetical protein